MIDQIKGSGIERQAVLQQASVIRAQSPTIAARISTAYAPMRRQTRHVVSDHVKRQFTQDPLCLLQRLLRSSVSVSILLQVILSAFEMAESGTASSVALDAS